MNLSLMLLHSGKESHRLASLVISNSGRLPLRKGETCEDALINPAVEAFTLISVAVTALSCGRTWVYALVYV